jgi:hypothetical protein
MYKRGVVQVWDVDDPDWLCKISEGPAGLAFSRWGPHERQILNTNDFNVRVSVWDLSDSAGVVASLRAPKFAEKVDSRQTGASVSPSALPLASLCRPCHGRRLLTGASPQGMSFSRDHRFLAVAERRDCKDFVQIYR